MKKDNFCSFFVLMILFCFQAPVLTQNTEPQIGGNTLDQGLNLTLRDAVNIALEKNRDILIAYENIKKAEAQVKAAYGNAFPHISLETNYTRNLLKPSLFIPPNTPFNDSSSPLKFELGLDNNYTAGVSLSQILFSAKVNTAILIAKDYKELSKYNAQTVKEELILFVKKAFYTVLLTKKIVEATGESLDLIKAHHENLKKLYDQGMISEFDLLRADVQVANTEPLLSQAENGFALSKNALKNLLGIELDKEITLIGSLETDFIPDETVEKESSHFLERNNTLKGLLTYEKILDKNIKIQKSDYYPTLAFFGNYQMQTQDNGFHFDNYNTSKTSMVGISLSYTLFNGFQTKFKIQEAIVEKATTALDRLKYEDGMRIALEEAKLRMNEAGARIHAQEKSVEQALKALSIADVRFKNGLGTQLEFIDAQNALTRTRINKVQAVYDYMVARADWEKISGFHEPDF